MKDFWKKLKKKVLEKAIELLILGFLAFLTLMSSLLYDKAKESLAIVIRQEIRLENVILKEQQLDPINTKMDALVYQDSISDARIEKIGKQLASIQIAISGIKLPKEIKVDNTDYNEDLEKVVRSIESLKSNQDSIGDEYFKQKKRILDEYERQLNILLKQLPK